jgi:hypothetical protein
VSDSTPYYIGINKEGKCRAAISDDPEHDKDRKRETAKEIGAWIRRGMTIERVTAAEARRRLIEDNRREVNGGVGG